MSWALPLLFLGWPWLVGAGGAAAWVMEGVWLCIAVPAFAVHKARRARRLAGQVRVPPAGPRPRVPIPPEVKAFVWVRDGGRCRSCRLSDSDSMALHGEHLQYDHVIPWARGGTNAKENVQLLCGPENRAKGASLNWRSLS
jgi:5-methylcytosine-specific restriction endonuclease McrA